MSARHLLCCVCLVLTAAAPRPVHAQWSADGVTVCGPPCDPGVPRIVADGAGGVFVTWPDTRSYPTTDQDVYLQHLVADGRIAAGWPAGGLPVCTAVRPQALTDMVADGHGGVLVVWIDFRDPELGLAQDIYAQRITGEGTIAPGWPVEGKLVTRAPDRQSVPVIAPDGDGGAYVSWDDRRDQSTTGYDLYAQHLTATGEFSPGWSVDGLQVAASSIDESNPRLVADGLGGVVVVWFEGHILKTDPMRLVGERLLPDGSVAPGWAAGGTVLLADRLRHRLDPDDASGFYLSCAAMDPIYWYNDAEYFVQRFTFAGTVAPGWPAAGVRVCAAAGDRDQLEVAPDGLGGLLLAWHDYRSGGIEIYAARVLADGTPAPGWTPDGVMVSSSTPFTNEFDPGVVGDGRGGAYVVWNTRYETSHVRLQHLDPFGQVAAGWPAGGLDVIPTTTSDFDPVIASDGAGGAIVAWEYRLGNELRAQRYQLDGPVAVSLALAMVNAAPDRVSLLWQGEGAAALAAAVQRRDPASVWITLGTAQPDGTDRLRFEDRSVTPGERYAYRLAWREGALERFSAEAWVTVPAQPALALEGFRPNPASGVPQVAFALPSAEPARLEVLDLAGRRVASHAVGTLGPGRHLLRLAPAAPLPAGIYLLRLTHGDRVLTTRGAVVR